MFDFQLEMEGLGLKAVCLRPQMAPKCLLLAVFQNVTIVILTS